MSVGRARLGKQGEAAAGGLPPLLVEADRVAATVAQGVHGRRRVGTGESFWQFRRYHPGDSIGRVDWRQTAKTQAVYLRELEWEAAQSVWLWRDGSSSMDYASSKDLPVKRERAELLLLALGSLLGRAGESIALLGAGSPPSVGRSNLSRVALMLEHHASGEGLPVPEPVPRHSELVMFGDFLEPYEKIAAAITGYVRRGVRGHLIQILDPAEQALPFDGRVRFSGMEDETDTLVPRVDSVRQGYHDRLAEHQDRLRALTRAAGWSFAVHTTDRPATSALLVLHAALSNSPLSWD